MKLEARFPDGVTQEDRELLERRAARLREKPREAEEESVLWAAEFPVGEDSYALPLESLRAAVPLRMVTPVPLPHALVEEARARQAGAVAEVTLPGLHQVNLLDLRLLMDRRASEKRDA